MADIKRTIYVEDGALNNLEQDNFGHKHIADAVVESILHTRPPYIIGVFGGWGSGKSSLLGMIDENLKKENVLTVTIDAWRYSSSDNLRRAFLVHVANKLTPSLLDDLRQKLYTSEQETLPGNAVNKFGATRPLAKSIRRIAFNSFVLSTVFFGIVLLYYVLVNYFQFHSLQDAWNNLNWQNLLNNFVKLVFIPLLWPIVSDLGLYIIHRPVTIIHERIDADELFSDYFEKVVKESTSNILHKKRLVIFVDNLDRLTNEKMVDALESLKTYLNNDNCVFVVACDDNVVRSVINNSKTIPNFQEERLGDKENGVEVRAGEHYLDKFFQQTFRLPEYMGINLHDFAMENLRTTYTYDDLMSRNVDVRNLVSIILPSDVGSPRKVKRLLNEFIALHEIVKRRENEKDGQLRKGTLTDNIEFLGKFSTLRAEYPDFYKSLIVDSSLLARTTSLMQQSSEVVKVDLTNLGVENISSLMSYLRKTRTVSVNDVEPYIWLSQDSLALGLKGNQYSQLRTSLADGNIEQVKAMLDGTEDNDYKIRLAKVASRLVTQRLVGIEQQNGLKVLSHLLSRLDNSIQSEIANAVANLIPEWPADVFSADEILNVLRWAYGLGIRTQKDELINQIIGRLDVDGLRLNTFEAILENADVIESNQGTHSVQKWLSEILKPENQLTSKENVDGSSLDKNLKNREFAEWFISRLAEYSDVHFVVDSYYSHEVVDYAALRLVGQDNLEGVFINDNGLGQNINNLFTVLARRINNGATRSRYWDGLLEVIDETGDEGDLEFALNHIINQAHNVPVNKIEKFIVGAFLTLKSVTEKSGEKKVDDLLIVKNLNLALEMTDKLRKRKDDNFDASVLGELPKCISELMSIPILQEDFINFLDRFSKYGKWDADLFAVGVLLALGKPNVGIEVERRVIDKVLNLDNLVNDENRDRVLSKLNEFILSSDVSKIGGAEELLERILLLDSYRKRLEVFAQNWIDKFPIEEVGIMKAKVILFHLLIMNKLVSPDFYVKRVVELLPFGGDQGQLQVVFDEIEKISQFVTVEQGKLLHNAVIANIGILGTVFPKALSIIAFWVDSIDDNARLIFDSNVIALYESSPNEYLPISLVSWTGMTVDQIRHHLVQILLRDIDDNLKTSRDIAIERALVVLGENEMKDAAVFIWKQLANERDAAEQFMAVAKKQLSYNGLADVRQNALSIVRDNEDQESSINNLRFLASTLRDDVDDSDAVFRLFVNLFGRSADDVRMAAKYAYPCLMNVKLDSNQKYFLSDAMAKAATRTSDDIHAIEECAKDFKLKWFRYRGNSEDEK